MNHCKKCKWWFLEFVESGKRFGECENVEKEAYYFQFNTIKGGFETFPINCTSEDFGCVLWKKRVI